MFRTLDVVLGVFGLIMLAALLPFLALAVRIDSPGPAIFRQQRVGRNGGLFTCYKLRTMVLGTRQCPSHQVGAAAITRTGALLRRTKLDELPQLWNVVIGNMSLVGPRPCIPGDVEVVEARRAAGIDRLRPGITGPAQVARIDMSTPRALIEADRLWLRPTLGSYLDVLVRTALGQGSADAAIRHA